MKSLLLILTFSVLTNFVNATNWYVDDGAAGSNSGTLANPWKTLSDIVFGSGGVVAGDSLLFRAGDTFDDILTIGASGSSGNRIVISRYGVGANPKFIGTGSPEQYLFYQFNRSYITYDRLHITDPDVGLGTAPIDSNKVANIERAFTFDGTSSNNIVQNCFAELVGVVFYTTGAGGSNTIQDCEATNLRMIFNNVGGDNDYGCNFSIITNANNIVTRNNVYDCTSKSYDYIYDGGAVEFYDNAADNNIVSYNRFVNCLVVSEYGSSGGGTCTGNKYYYNLCINNGNFIWVNSSGGFAVSVSGIEIHNNVIVEDHVGMVGDNFMIGISTNTATAGQFEMINNIFYLRAGLDVIRSANSALDNGTAMIHTNNRYNLGSGSVVNLTLDGTETSSTAAIWLDQLGPPETSWDFHPLDETTLDDGANLSLSPDYYGIAVTNPYYIGIAQWAETPPDQPATQTQFRTTKRFRNL